MAESSDGAAGTRAASVSYTHLIIIKFCFFLKHFKLTNTPVLISLLLCVEGQANRWHLAAETRMAKRFQELRGAELTHGQMQALEERQASAHLGLTVDGFDVRMQGVGRKLQLGSELFFAAIGIEPGQHAPFALGQVRKGRAEFLRRDRPQQ